MDPACASVATFSTASRAFIEMLLLAAAVLSAFSRDFTVARIATVAATAAAWRDVWAPRRVWVCVCVCLRRNKSWVVAEVEASVAKRRRAAEAVFIVALCGE
jgi:hypothetical protein